MKSADLISTLFVVKVNKISDGESYPCGAKMAWNSS